MFGADSLRQFEGREVTKIRVYGHRTTRDYVIRRELRTRVGESLTRQKVRADLQRLENLDIFSSMSVEASPDGEGVALTYRVREIPPVIPYISYDVTDEDGWSFGPAVKSVNMMGMDIFVAGWALFGGKNIFMLDLNHPWISGNHLSLDLDLSRIERRNKLDGFDETVLEFSPWLGIYLGERGRLKFGFSYFQVQSDQASHTLTEDGLDHLFRLGTSLGFDSRDNWGDPRRGWANEGRLIKTGGRLPGDANFWTAILDVRRFQPLPFATSHTMVLAALTTLQTGNIGRDLPEHMDFHLGGSNSIRGYDVEQLGSVLEGRNQLLGTVEYRFPVLTPREFVVWGMAADLGLSGALFVDSGLAWTDSEQFSLGRAKTGAGFGIRMLMPAVEMTRLDVGFDEEGNWRIHFASFSKMDAQRLRLR